MIHFNYTGTEEDNIQLRRMFNEYFERGIHVTRLRPREMSQPWIDKIEKHLIHYKPLLEDKDLHMENAWYMGKINPYQVPQSLCISTMNYYTMHHGFPVKVGTHPMKNEF